VNKLKISKAEARTMIKEGKAILLGRDVLWERLGDSEIQIYVRNEYGFHKSLISKKAPEILDKLFQKYKTLSLILL